MSTERIVVDQKVADEFVAQVRREGAALPAGDPREGEVVLGSLVDLEAARAIAGADRRRAGEGREARRRRHRPTAP